VIKRLATIRAGTTAVAIVIVAIALVAGAMALLTVLRGTLVDEVKDAAGAQALEVARQLDSGRPPILEVAPSDEQLIQVLSPDGSVVASSRNVAGEAAVARLRPGESEQVLTPLDSEEFMAVAEGAQTSDGPRTVLVARALIGVFETTAVVTKVMLIGLPLLLVVVAVTTWVMVGRALAPVDAIRREVDEISAAQLYRRVPQPDADDEIGRLAATMNRMLVRLEGARNSQRRFVSDASHELRSPITTIRQHAEVALAHPDRLTAQELADVVLAEQTRMQSLVEDLLLLARADEHVPLVGDDVVLTVDDDGPGIPESERERVLQRFVRLDEARSRDDGGSGLGLSIVDEVVRAHGGSMSITQSPLGGTRIEVTLPADEG